MKRMLLSIGTLAALAPLAAAQLPDLQPGRNFPTAQSAFGTGRSENVDVGDCDNDGDYDVIIANGGDGSAQANKIYINNGGIQGGTIGTFSDQSGARFAGVPNDTSRDVEFADFDGDADLDVYVSNRGTTTNGGEVSRSYINEGGLQFGSIGFYTEYTDTFWGNLVSVPAGDEVGAQDGQGPWKDYTCDCDFGDLDDDGDVDLFHSSYGPNINGSRDSRIFLNDGDGVFNELFPWVDPGADIKTHTLDFDLTDFDDDYDLDIFMSSRNSQARVFRSNLYGGTGSGALYTDVTQTALINTGATLVGSTNYEAEFGDVDGDGDFDVWAKNYQNTLDRILRNNGNFTFTKMSNWIVGDPNKDENEIDFLDFDNDGDLDAFVANFSGTNSLYQSGLADGVPFSSGIYHRTGTGGTLAPQPEAPASGNGGTTLDGECADMDMDGDTDILLSNDGNQPNRYWQNALGVPDTHAPTFHQITNQGNKSDGTDTVIHAQIRDNANFYVIAYYGVDLVYTVNGGDETCVQMLAQGGQTFRGVIPGELNGTIAYRIEATDDAGNKAVSSTFSYNQTSSSITGISNLGCGTQGVAGDPYLYGKGTVGAGNLVVLNLTDAAPNALAGVFLAASSSPVPFKGGTLYAFPAINVFLNTDAGGGVLLPVTWPAGIPSGSSLYWQWAISDAAATGNVSLSNAVKTTQP